MGVVNLTRLKLIIFNLGTSAGNNPSQNVLIFCIHFGMPYGKTRTTGRHVKQLTAHLDEILPAAQTKPESEYTGIAHAHTASLTTGK